MQWDLRGLIAMLCEVLTTPARGREAYVLVIWTTAKVNCILHERESLMHRH